MSSRIATGTRKSEATERAAKRSRQVAMLWKLTKAAIRVVDASRSVGRGSYQIPPELMIALKHHCDEMRFPLKMQELEILKGGDHE